MTSGFSNKSRDYGWEAEHVIFHDFSMFVNLFKRCCSAICDSNTKPFSGNSRVLWIVKDSYRNKMLPLGTPSVVLLLMFKGSPRVVHQLVDHGPHMNQLKYFNRHRFMHRPFSCSQDLFGRIYF